VTPPPLRPALSVVIPTHDRRDSLLRLLSALEAGTLPPARFEVIVVADGCSDDTVQAAGAAPFSFPVKVLAMHPARGAAAARNLGATEARGPILVFLDDDIEPLPGLLATHLDLHLRHGTEPTAVIGAPIPARGPRDGYQHIAVWHWWESQLARMERPGHRFSYQDVFTGVLSLPASLFHAVGAFAADLPESCRDDWEFGIRLLARGTRLVFSREGGGVHHEMRDHARLRARKEAEGRADVALAARHPALWPSLRLAGRPSGVARGLTWLALHLPRASLALERMLEALLTPLEWVGARGAWRMVQGASLHAAYWRGVGRELGSRAPGTELRRLAARWRATRQAAAPRILKVDLANGLNAAEALLEAERPEGADVRFGAFRLGEIAAAPWLERLRGVHLRMELAGGLAPRLMVALALGAGAAARLGAVGPPGR
jgi:GT2 family glycosyltransferase